MTQSFTSTPLTVQKMTGSTDGAITGWSARHDHSSVALPDGCILMMGGVGQNGRSNDIWRSTDQGTTWMQMTASAQWSARSDHISMALPDGSIVLMGGFDSASQYDGWRVETAGSHT